LYEPYMITSVGFQLSFLAVIGILYLHPFIYAWWEPKAWVMDEVWKITSVSIAAQIATLPLGFLYFHQFPNYFLFTNLVVIPGSFVVLVAGIGLLALSFAGPVATVLGFVLTWTIRILNSVVFFFESLPFSVISNILISPAECLLLIAVIVFVTLLLVKRRLQFLIFALITSIPICLLQWERSFHEQLGGRITIYRVPGHSAVDFIANGHTIFWADSILTSDVQQQRFHIYPNRILHRVEKVYPVANERVWRGVDAELLIWQGIRIVRITGRDAKDIPAIPIDLMIISNNSWADFSGLPGNLTRIPIILDSSNSYYFADNAIQETKRKGLNVYSVLHAGAFELELKNRLP
jgi:competence protein ComEC